jgi:hypothetical protein
MSLYGFSWYSNKSTNFVTFKAYKTNKMTDKIYETEYYVALYEELIN